MTLNTIVFKSTMPDKRLKCGIDYRHTVVMAYAMGPTESFVIAKDSAVRTRGMRRM